MSWFAPRIVTACSSCAVGLASLWVWSVNPTNVSKFIEVIGESPFPAWIAGAVSTASALTAAYFWYRQRKVHEMFQIYMKDALENDLNDVPTIFGLRSHDGSPECFPSGSSGFWIAEEGEKIIGFVGLREYQSLLYSLSNSQTFISETGVSEEERIGEVRRMVVSPSHRRRGVGKKLMDAVDKHAKANGIAALELTTSDYNVGALKMYNKCGWRLKRRRIYEGILLHVLRKDL